MPNKRNAIFKRNGNRMVLNRLNDSKFNFDRKKNRKGFSHRIHNVNDNLT